MFSLIKLIQLFNLIGKLSYVCSRHLSLPSDGFIEFECALKEEASWRVQDSADVMSL